MKFCINPSSYDYEKKGERGREKKLCKKKRENETKKERERERKKERVTKNADLPPAS